MRVCVGMCAGRLGVSCQRFQHARLLCRTRCCACTTLILRPHDAQAASSALIPPVFEILADSLEEWQTPLYVIQITVVRSVIQKLAVFIAFINAITKTMSQYACWETSIGMQTYANFLVGPLLVEMFTSIAVDIAMTCVTVCTGTRGRAAARRWSVLCRPAGSSTVRASVRRAAPACSVRAR